MHFDFFYSLPSSSVVLLHLYSSRFNSYRRYFTIIYYYLWEQMEQKRQKSQFDRCKDSKWLQVMTRLEDERGKCKSWCNGECRWGAGGGGGVQRSFDWRRVVGEMRLNRSAWNVWHKRLEETCHTWMTEYYCKKESTKKMQILFFQNQWSV